MNSIKDIIKHPGTIEKITEEKVMVNILAKSACSSCHAKGSCSVADMEDKVIEVRKTDDFNYEVGDEVTVFMKKSLGSKAVFYGYLYPFLLLFATLIVVIVLTGHEGLAALASLLILVPYYFALNKFKDKLSTTFEFKIL